jgi:RNA polymerase sigma-32 factor
LAEIPAGTATQREEVVTSARDSEIRSRWLAEAMGELSSRQRAILQQRCLREEDAALEELSRELGVCKERVRQLEHRAR